MKVWIAVNRNGNEVLFNTNYCPYRESFQRNLCYPQTFWATDSVMDMQVLKRGTIKKLIGRELTWEDSPQQVEINLV